MTRPPAEVLEYPSCILPSVANFPRLSDHLCGTVVQVELFLETFLDYAKKPGTHASSLGDVHPEYPHFTGFVFKVKFPSFLFRFKN